MTAGPTIALAAGGTGGHMFPAFAVADALLERGYTPIILTDRRGERYLDMYQAGRAFTVQSSTLVKKTPYGLMNLILKNAQGLIQARRYLKQNNVKALIGFGGYPSLPPVIAARTLRLPILLQEQNAVMGRANAMLAHFSNHVAFAMPSVKGVERLADSKYTVTGLPLRDHVIQLAGAPYPELSHDAPINLLVFGGSQGAQILTDRVPEALSGLPEKLKCRLCVTQQCRDIEQSALKNTYESLGIKATVSSLFTDLPERIAASHLVIARAGASTVCELGTIGRPAILVPLAASLDQDQSHNAKALAGTGGTLVLKEPDLTSEVLRHALESWLSDPEALTLKANLQAEFNHAGAAQSVAKLAVNLFHV